MANVSIASSDREGPPARATVTVRGDATVRAEPDAAILWVTLSGSEESPNKALEGVAERADAFGAVLDELDVGEADRSTAGVSVAAQFDPPARGNRGFVYRATARIAVHLADADVIGKLIARASEEFQASVEGPRWYVTSANPARVAAARQAAADARTKADAFAVGAGASLGALLQLVEPETANPPGASRQVSDDSDGPDVPIDVEEYEVRATIDATFALTTGDDGGEDPREPSPRPAPPKRAAGRRRP